MAAAGWRCPWTRRSVPWAVVVRGSGWAGAGPYRPAGPGGRDADGRCPRRGARWSAVPFVVGPRAGEEVRPGAGVCRASRPRTGPMSRRAGWRASRPVGAPAARWSWFPGFGSAPWPGGPAGGPAPYRRQFRSRRRRCCRLCCRRVRARCCGRGPRGAVREAVRSGSLTVGVGRWAGVARARAALRYSSAPLCSWPCPRRIAVRGRPVRRRVGVTLRAGEHPAGTGPQVGADLTRTSPYRRVSPSGKLGR